MCRAFFWSLIIAIFTIDKLIMGEGSKNKLKNQNDKAAIDLYTLEDCHKLACSLISDYLNPDEVKKIILNNR